MVNSLLKMFETFVYILNNISLINIYIEFDYVETEL